MKIYETLPNGVQIVEYEESLAPTLADMWNQSREDWGGGNDIKTGDQVIARHVGAANYNVYVAVANGEAVGYCSLARYYSDADTLYIPLLGVRPDYHGKKVGKALVLKCLYRTIELGYSRMDLHTWSGNTAAVPLYKKCGYLWEDRPDSTHLVNFIPGILKTELFADFFKKADWYNDSTRSLEIVPDGVNVNDFETFGYTWEKDGETLAIGFERTGRRMRLIETSDYKIELMAENHELAFGLDYNCTFSITNKSGKDLHVKIIGKDDDNIKFGYAHESDITGTVELKSKFHVGEIHEIQSEWKTHPCLLADVEINGYAIAFGLGIESKFPLMVTISEESKVNQAGMDVSAYIDVESSLLQDAVISFSVPDNGIVSFNEEIFTANIPAKGKTSIPAAGKTLAIGYEPLPTRYNIALKDGREFSFEKPLHYWNQNLTQAFSCETNNSYRIINGPWQLLLDKQDSTADIKHILDYNYSQGTFDPPKFGKPYDDEFNLIKPTVTSFQDGADMVMEACYLSEKFPGMAITQVFTLSAAGVITRKHRVQNRSRVSRSIMICDTYGLALGDNTTFSCQGQITQNHSIPKPDGSHYGVNGIDPSDIDENWIFEASATHPKGFCWSPTTKPNFLWGSWAIFEIDAGELAPNQIFETEPVMYLYGIFSYFGDLRNYAMKTWNRESIVPANRVEVKINNFNPFMADKSTALEIVNNRNNIIEGTITLSGDCKKQTQESAEGKPSSFTLTPKFSENMGLIRVDMNLATYDKSFNRAVFFPSGEVTCRQEGSVYSVNNGKITFKADPKYAALCYSLISHHEQDYEWLLHQHPEHKPFGWWNPFLGGMCSVRPPNMNQIAAMKEQSTADFAEATDNYGNVWSGIKTTLTVTEDKEQRGAIFESYFVTLPGLPLMCTFYRFINGTGVFKDDVLNTHAFLNIADDYKEIYAEMTDKNRQQYRLHFGSSSVGANFENIVKLSGPRPQNLYVFHGNKNNGKSNGINGDNKYPAVVEFYMEAHAEPGKTFTSSPVFFLVTDRDLSGEALDDFERITFK